MKAFFALALLAVVAMATADHHEGHVGTQPVVQPAPEVPAVEPTHVETPAKDLKGSEAVYVAAPYAYTAYGAGYPVAYGALPYAYGAYPAYSYYG